MSIEQYDLRVLIRHYWKKGLNIRDAVDEICAIEGAGTVKKTCVGKWFKRFEEGNFCLQDQPRCGRPEKLNKDDLLELVITEPSLSSRDMAKELCIDHVTILRHLKKLDFVHKKPRQDPHELTEEQANRRVEVCSQLLLNPLDDRFWKRIVTSDEKWVYLVNHDKKRQWVPRGTSGVSVPRQNKFGKKAMISVWWNFEGVLHFEMVPYGKAIDAELYCQQLQRVYDKLKEKYPSLVNRKRAIFQQDNAKPHTAKKTLQKFKELDGVELLPHPAYSPDAAPSDYGLFRSMEHFLRGRRFESFHDIEKACQQFFLSKEPTWYFNQIRMLADRWQKIVENCGLYFED